MARYTTTLNEYLTSELQAIGLNEFVSDNELVYTDENFQFIQKILYFDEDVEEIVNHRIFKGFKFKDAETDRVFKEAFILRFIDREINRQTIEAFASQVLYVTLTHQEYIYNVFSSELTKFLQNHVIDKTEDIGNAISKEIQNQNTKENSNGKDHNTTTVDTTSDTTGTDKNVTTGNENSNVNGTSKHREATATLPQSQQNLNLNSDTMAYADSQSGANDKTTQDTTSDSESNSNTDTKSKTTGNSNSISDGTNENERVSTTDQNATQNQDTVQNHDGITVTYDLDNLEQLFDMKEKIFDIYDKKCFLQIW